jgi:hypothetical protein
MHRRTLRLSLLSLLAIGTIALGPSVRPARTQASCQASRSKDSACLNTPFLFIRRGRQPANPVTTRGAVVVRRLSQVSVAGGGVTDLFLKTEAECQAIDPGSGTKLQTRPTKDFLFTLFNGLILCTMADGKAVQLSGYTWLEASSEGQAPPTRFRVILDPGAVVQIAVLEGHLILHQSGGHELTIAKDKERVITLAGPNEMLDVTTRHAKFSDLERHTFMLQKRLIR